MYWNRRGSSCVISRGIKTFCIVITCDRFAESFGMKLIIPGTHNLDICYNHTNSKSFILFISYKFATMSHVKMSRSI